MEHIFNLYLPFTQKLFSTMARVAKLVATLNIFILKYKFKKICLVTVLYVFMFDVLYIFMFCRRFTFLYLAICHIITPLQQHKSGNCDILITE